MLQPLYEKCARRAVARPRSVSAHANDPEHVRPLMIAGRTLARIARSRTWWYTPGPADVGAEQHGRHTARRRLLLVRRPLGAPLPCRAGPCRPDRQCL